MQLCIGAASNPDDRPKIEISGHDYDRLCAHPKESNAFIQVRDYLSGQDVEIRWEDCGLDCRCALALSEESRQKLGLRPEGDN